MDKEQSLRLWKRIAIVAMLISVALVAAVVAIGGLPSRIFRLTDERLTGTWQSDADRTIAGMQTGQPKDSAREVKLRNLFGKMRITYSSTTYTTELEGSINTYGYQILGRDKHSVVIREIENGKSPLDFLELSSFTVIHFDRPDSYWVDSEIGEIREYFKRVY